MPPVEEIAEWIVGAESQIKGEWGLATDPPSDDPVVVWAAHIAGWMP